MKKEDLASQEKMLSEIFKELNKAPGKSSIKEIKKEARKRFFKDNFLIMITAVAMVVTLVLPFLFPHSHSVVSVDSMERKLSIASSEMTEDSFKISFSGAEIDTDSSYMLGDDNSCISPSYYNEETNTIEFPYDFKEYNIYIYDIYGRSIHLLLTPLNQRS